MTKSVRAIVAVAIGLVIGAALLLAIDRTTAERWLRQVPLIERIYSRWIPPQAPPVQSSSTLITSEEQTAFARLAREAGGRGRFIWSSNREGNHELYIIALSDLSVRRLTRNSHVDYFARFSSDGRRLVFLRSQRPWVSFREAEAWDLYLMNADGAGERRLAVGAYHPAWTPDGSSVTFVRGNTVIRIDVETGTEKTVFEGSDPPTEGRLGDPALGVDGLLCMSLRGGKGPRGVGVLNLSTKTYRGLSGPSACHSTWLPGSRTVIWVDANGHGGTRVMRADADRGTEEELIDLPGAFSHEYFPQVSSDRRWLVWGASVSGHEHDRADYEMFAWAIGSPWDTAIRLTYSAANDQWPDFHHQE